MSSAACQLNINKERRIHQLAQTISVRVMKFELSSLRITAPGTVSKNAGHPQPEALGSAYILRRVIGYTHNFCFEV